MNDNAIMFHYSVGESTIYWVDDQTFNELFKIYMNQKPDGYDEMIEDFHFCFEKHRTKKSFEHCICQWNSYDEFHEPRITKRFLYVL